MISFAPTEDEAAVQAVVQSLARSRLRSLAPAIDAAAEIPANALAQVWAIGAAQAVLDSSREVARSRVLTCVLLEELAWADASLAVVAGASLGLVQAVVDHGSPGQKARAQAVYGGDRFTAGAVLIQEPGFESDVGALTTQAERRGEAWSITGAKSFIPLVESCADLLVVARCEGALAAFIVPRQTAGVQIIPPKGSLGLKGCAFGAARFDGVTVPLASRLGETAGCDVSSLISSARTGLGAIQTGVARAVFEHITPYVKQRVAHGSALARKQSVAFRLADMFIDTPSMRWMCWQAASALEKGRPAAREGRLAQIHCAEKLLWIADEGLQLMGGHGYMSENPVERWYRDAHTLALLDGVVGV